MQAQIPFICPHMNCGKTSHFFIQQDIPFWQGQELKSVKSCPKCLNKLLFKAVFRNNNFENISTAKEDKLCQVS